VESMTENIDSGMTVGLEQELIADLTAELSLSDKNFNLDLLISKVRNALKEVEKARKYPTYYTENQIARDMYDYYSNVRNIALYDYNLIGAEGQTSSSENGTSRSYVERDKLFSGIIPLSKC